MNDGFVQQKRDELDKTLVGKSARAVIILGDFLFDAFANREWITFENVGDKLPITSWFYKTHPVHKACEVPGYVEFDDWEFAIPELPTSDKDRPESGQSPDR